MEKEEKEKNREGGVLRTVKEQKEEEEEEEEEEKKKKEEEDKTENPRNLSAAGTRDLIQRCSSPLPLLFSCLVLHHLLTLFLHHTRLS